MCSDTMTKHETKEAWTYCR